MQPPAPPKVQFLLNATQSTIPTVLDALNKIIDNYLSNSELRNFASGFADNCRKLNTLAEAPPDTREQYHG